MIEKVLHKNRLFALIVRRQFRRKSGITFFTSKESSQYCITKTYEILKKWNVDISNYHFIEPSAGDGSFYNLQISTFVK